MWVIYDSHNGRFGAYEKGHGWHFSTKLDRAYRFETEEQASFNLSACFDRTCGVKVLVLKLEDATILYSNRRRTT